MIANILKRSVKLIAKKCNDGTSESWNWHYKHIASNFWTCFYCVCLVYGYTVTMTFKATDMVFVHNKWSCQIVLKPYHAGHGYGWKETGFHWSTLTLVRAWDTPSLQNHFGQDKKMCHSSLWIKFTNAVWLTFKWHGSCTKHIFMSWWPLCQKLLKFHHAGQSSGSDTRVCHYS